MAGSKEIEVFVDGPITDLQRRLKRQSEAQWYVPLTQLALGRKMTQYLPRIGIRKGRVRVYKLQTEDLPVVVKHQWKEIRTADWLDLFTAAGQVYANGTGPIDQKKFYELMSKGRSTSWDLKELEEKQNSLVQAAKEAMVRDARQTRVQSPSPP